MPVESNLKITHDLIAMTLPTTIDTAAELETYLLQDALTLHGYPLKRDGIRGSRTEAALAQAFTDHLATLATNGQRPTTPIYAERAASFVGTAEIPGAQANPTILAWIKSILPSATDDSTAWCAAFVNAMLATTGIKGTGKANARSFLNWGSSTETPQKGDIVVLWRVSKDSWQGHVGFYWGHSGDNIRILGGNQSNQVSIQLYPAHQLLGYRRPS